jgi:hypothetical protein
MSLPEQGVRVEAASSTKVAEPGKNAQLGLSKEKHDSGKHGAGQRAGGSFMHHCHLAPIAASADARFAVSANLSGGLPAARCRSSSRRFASAPAVDEYAAALWKTRLPVVP